MASLLLGVDSCLESLPYMEHVDYASVDLQQSRWSQCDPWQYLLQSMSATSFAVNGSWLYNVMRHIVKVALAFRVSLESRRWNEEAVSSVWSPCLTGRVLATSNNFPKCPKDIPLRQFTIWVFCLAGFWAFETWSTRRSATDTFEIHRPAVVNS